MITYIVGIYDGLTLREERKIGNNLDAGSLKHLKVFLSAKMIPQLPDKSL